MGSQGATMNEHSADQSAQRLPVRSALGRRVGCILAAIVVLALVPVLWQVRRWYVFHAERDRVDKITKSLENRRPATVSERAWNNGIGWSVNALYNICVSPGQGRLEDMTRFRMALEDKLQGDVDLSVFDWIWDRIGEVGPYGRHYTDKFRSIFQAWLKPDAAEMGKGDD